MSTNTNCKLRVLLVCLALLCGMYPFAGAAEISGALHQVEASILSRARASHIEDAAMASVLDALRHAAQHDCPLEPLVQKIEEGLAKQIPPERIAVALQTMVSRYERFGKILDQAQAGTGMRRLGLLERMNSLAAMGVDVEELLARSEKPGAPDLDQLLNAYESRAALQTSGLSATNATELMEVGLGSGFFTAPGLGLPRFVRVACDRGVPQNEIMRLARQIALRQQTPRAAAAELGLEWGRFGRGRGAGGAGSPDACPAGGNGPWWKAGQ